MVNLTKQQSLIIFVVAVFIFFFSLGISAFGGYTIPILLVVSIIFYFFSERILYLFQHQGSYFVIFIMSFIMLIIFLLAYGLNMVLENRKKINSQWPTYKCKPYILPFAGTFVGPSGTSPTQNFTECMWEINKSFFNILISPFVNMIELILGILTGLVDDVQNIRKMIAYLRSNIKMITMDIYQRLYDTYARIAYIVKKVMRIFSKLFDVFRDLFNVLLYSFYTVASIWNGPIGGTARTIGKITKFFCFDGETQLRLKNGKKVEIRNVQIGDVLEGNHRVMGIMKFDAANVPMYEYCGVKVSGEHLVLEKNRWTRVEESKLSEKIDYEKPFIYCLITKSALIRIGNLIFTDYMEINNKIFNKYIYQTVLNFLNRKSGTDNSSNLDDLANVYYWGFHKNTLINMKNNAKKKIKDIKIGDEISTGRVIGKVKIQNDNIKMYQYQCGSNIILSGTSIIYNSNQWIPIYKDKNAKIIDKDSKIYNIITDTNLIEIGDKLFRDFEQTNDPKLNDFIDKFLTILLNNP